MLNRLKMFPLPKLYVPAAFQHKQMPMIIQIIGLTRHDSP